ncbi:MAG: hypothetical protein KBA40_03485 [Candidatus Peribacteraceae bacterium]|nr:hypothetical protein [Candidatus Peribacteraceae bacterium]MBP9850641.1 hypothetical protein [Candidatus Peribacteraceae bacterium]
MNKFFVTHRQTCGVASFVAGIVLSIAACGVLASHASLFSQKRDTAVMIGTQLPELKTAVALLSANVEAERIFADQALTAREEQAAVYVLPNTSPSPRTVKTLQEISRALAADGVFALDKLTFDAKPTDEGSFKTLAAHAVFRGSFQNMARMLAVLGFGGDMVVRDTLSPEVQELFLRQVEAVSPHSLRRAEDFLYLDLMQYAADPDKNEQRMLEDVPTAVVSDIRATLLAGGLGSVRSAFSGIAAGLYQKGLWPTPLMKVTGLERAGDRWTVEFTVFSR